MNPAWLPGGKDYRPANGASVHGGANGSERGGKNAEFDAENQPDIDDKLAGKQSKARVRAFLEAKRMDAAKKLIEIIDMDEKTALQLAAVNSLFDRLDGKPVQAVSGLDGEALPATIAVSFVRPSG